MVKRHIPHTNEPHDLRVAFGKLWDAIERGPDQGTTTQQQRQAASFGSLSGTGVNQGALIGSHNTLNYIQGGQTEEYFHLTNAEYTGNGTGVFVRVDSPEFTGNPRVPTPDLDDASSSIANTEWVKGQNYQPQPPNSITKESTGFSDPSVIDPVYDETARTFTINGSFSAYWRGEIVPDLVSGWVSPAHPNTNGSWFLFYDGADYVWQQTTWTFDMLMIGYAYYDASVKFGIREVHGLMPWYAHEEFHRTNGTYLEAGGTLSGYTRLSTTAAQRRPAVATTIVHDEDIESTITALPDGGPYTVMNLTGTGDNTFTLASAEIVPVLANNPYYNLFSTPNWTQVLMANNSYMCVWLVAVPTTSDAGSLPYRYLWIQGQSNGSLAVERANVFGNLNLGTLNQIFTEFVPIAKLILRFQGGNWRIEEVYRLTGTKLTQGVAPAGNYLSTVTTDATLTGVGTVADPLSVVNPVGVGTASATTASLAPGATGGVSITLPKVAQILSIEIDEAAWVTLYTSDASRTADAGRPFSEDPVAGTGVTLDVSTPAASTIPLSPIPVFDNRDTVTPNTGYLRVQNNGAGSVPITVTITYATLIT